MRLENTEGAGPFLELKNEFRDLQQLAGRNKHFAGPAVRSVDVLTGVPELVASKIDESAAKVASFEKVACGNVADVRALLIKHSPEFADELARATSGGDRS